MKPFKAIKFDNIFKISAKNNPDDVKHIKTSLRKVLDVNEELKNTLEHKSLDYLKNKLRECGPVLV